MPVSIIENWSDIVGEVWRIHPDAEVPGFTSVEIDVRQVERVEGFANLLEEAVGTRIEVGLPDNKLADLGITVGSVVACRVRKARIDKIYVHRERIAVRPRGEATGHEAGG
ncbi:MAG TPA: hypothetical protein VJK02_14885 [Anaerolineales bacterium]|nr:hypothetical protein [Anaerolineales bacterium]